MDKESHCAGAVATTPPKPGRQPSESNGLRSTIDIGAQRLLPLLDLLVLQLLVAVGHGDSTRSLDSPAGRAARSGSRRRWCGWSAFRGISLPRLIALRTGFLASNVARGPARSDPGRTVRRAELADGAQIGFRWDGSTLLSLVRIEENPQAMTVMEPGYDGVRARRCRCSWWPTACSSSTSRWTRST